MRSKLTAYFKQFEFKTELLMCWSEARFEIVAMGVVTLVVALVVITC